MLFRTSLFSCGGHHSPYSLFPHFDNILLLWFIQSVSLICLSFLVLLLSFSPTSVLLGFLSFFPTSFVHVIVSLLFLRLLQKKRRFDIAANRLHYLLYYVFRYLRILFILLASSIKFLNLFSSFSVNAFLNSSSFSMYESSTDNTFSLF